MMTPKKNSSPAAVQAIKDCPFQKGDYVKTKTMDVYGVVHDFDYTATAGLHIVVMANKVKHYFLEHHLEVWDGK